VRRAAVAADYERRSDLDVIFDLAVRLGMGDAFFEGSVEAGLNDMLSRFGKTMAELRQEPNGTAVALDPTGNRKPVAGRDSTPRHGCWKSIHLYLQNTATIRCPDTKNPGRERP
jgi:hypothetical protein